MSTVRARAAVRPRILFFARPGDLADTVRDVLGRSGCEVQHIAADEPFLESVVRHPPEAVLFALQRDVTADLPLLQLLRRVNAQVPLLLMSHEGTLGERQRLQCFQPTYYLLLPLDPHELAEAVLSVANRKRPSAAAG
jgi:DNA-binding response OmpR family regulator